jgi:ribosomal protein L28
MHKEKKRKFQAEVTNEYFWWVARKAEINLGWSTKTVKLWLKELETGITCVLNYSKSWVKKQKIDYQI